MCEGPDICKVKILEKWCLWGMVKLGYSQYEMIKWGGREAQGVKISPQAKNKEENINFPIQWPFSDMSQKSEKSKKDSKSNERRNTASSKFGEIISNSTGGPRSYIFHLIYQAP